jgi:chromosome segregation protein
LEALLGASVEAITVSDLATARKILAQLEGEQIGSVCLQVADFTGAPAENTLPAGLRPAAEAVIDLDPAHPAASVLSACYLADDLGVFLEFWKANPSFSFLMVATPKGDLVDRRGLIFGGYHKKPANSIVQREVDLRETGKAVVSEQKAHDEQRALIDQLNAALNEAEAVLEQKRQEVLAASENAAVIYTEEKNAQRSHDEAGQRLTRMENELNTLKRDHDEALSRLARAQGLLTGAEAGVTAQKEKIAAIEAGISEKRSARDEKKEILSQARLELAERRQKVEVLDRGLNEMGRRRAQLDELLVQRQIELETWSDQVAQLEQEATNQRRRAEEVLTTLAVAQENVETIRRELLAVEQEIAAVEVGLASIRSESDSAQSELSKHEVKVAETRARVQFLVEEVTREFQIEISTLDWRHLLWHADDEPEGLKALDLDEEEDAVAAEPGAMAAQAAPRRRKKDKGNKGEATEADLAELDSTNWDEVRAEVDALRQRIGSMGAVNLVAIEEYSELKQRYEFLKTQCDDLTGAKAALLKAIDDINHTSLEQFKVTFDQIRKNFAYTFQILFGGGRAEIELVTADDPLESGIEIVAQPPGTKLKGITLLSGGQKTLTAVALLFALYMVKPSPFCLLDELDAPLDESNIHRFTNLLKQFVKESQFIIITHNKSTVAAADALYGVTMQERGVSKTVSMRFNSERGEAEVLPTTIADSVRSVAPQAPVVS